jgi:hypothetical protein
MGRTGAGWLRVSATAMLAAVLTVVREAPTL